ncbi:hypothetical protein ACFE04_007842 [Oxalis oulophora]
MDQLPGTMKNPGVPTVLEVMGCNREMLAKMVDVVHTGEKRPGAGACYELAQMCHISGMTFSPKPVLPALSARPEQVEKVLKARYHDAISKIPGKEIDLLIVILPDNNGSLYGDLKHIWETELGLVSQCYLTKHVFKMSKQYLANVALKINVKVGGRNTVLVVALSRRIPLVSDRPTIIFGADVTHPHPGEDSSPSIAADPVKGTMHGGMIKELMIAFRRATGQKPQPEM